MAEPSVGVKEPSRITWNEYFMGVAFLSAKRCKDQDSMAGACIVNNDNIIIGVGYNTLPKGCENMKSKKEIVCHAELNAIQNAELRDIKGCTMYVTLFPCNNCANIIIQSGIKKIIYLADNPANKITAAKYMFDATGVTYVSYNTTFYKKPIDHTKKMQIDSEEYFMGLAYLSAKRSKEALFESGACIVNKDGVIIGMGYNGLPRGMDEISSSPICHNQSKQCNQSKLIRFFKVCHAVINAVLNRNSNSVKDCTIYVTTYPCIECAKIILQFGITSLVYIKHNTDTTIAKELLETAGIFVSKYNLPKERIEIYESHQTSETMKNDTSIATSDQVLKLEHLMMIQTMKDNLIKIAKQHVKD